MLSRCSHADLHGVVSKHRNTQRRQRRQRQCERACAGQSCTQTVSPTWKSCHTSPGRRRAAEPQVHPWLQWNKCFPLDSFPSTFPARLLSSCLSAACLSSSAVRLSELNSPKTDQIPELTDHSPVRQSLPTRHPGLPETELSQAKSSPRQPAPSNWLVQPRSPSRGMYCVRMCGSSFLRISHCAPSIGRLDSCTVLFLFSVLLTLSVTRGLRAKCFARLM